MNGPLRQLLSGSLAALALSFQPCWGDATRSQTELLERVEATEGSERVDALNALSKGYWGVSAEQAMRHASQARELAQSSGYAAGEAAAWRNIGIAHWYSSDYDQALAASLQAREIYQQLADPQGEAATMSTIATILMNSQRIDEAIALYREAIPIAERAGDRQRLGIIYSNLGTAHLNEQPEKALEYLGSALPILREVGSQWDVLTCLANIGGAHRRLGRYEQTLAVNQEVLTIARDIGNHERIAEAIADIGQAHAGLEQYEQALSHLQMALDYASEHDLKRTRMTTLKSLADVHELMGNPTPALAALKLHGELSAEAVNAETAKAMADLQVRYETEQKEREIQIQRLQIERQRTQQVVLGLFLGAALIVTIVVFRLYQQKRRAVRELALLSRTDPLTGVANRRAVRRMASAIHGDTESGSYGVILIDIDHFKRINDQYGHDAGDAVLQGLASVLAANVRDNDLVGRWGGEEFVVVAPDVQAQSMAELAQRIHVAIADQPFVANGTALNVTATAGWTLRQPPESFDSALKRADDALYQGKKAGRNRLIAA